LNVVGARGETRRGSATRSACPACGKRQGTNAGCLSCRDAVAKELAREARDITAESLPGRAAAGKAFTERPPWYARTSAGKVLTKTRLLWMVIGDYAAGRYRRLPWRAALACAAALAYVLSPFDLIPDWIVPIGFADDLAVLALAWQAVKQELRDYCSWKGVSPSHFGL
jgi:uncharacterized membrane protein YkvA (DUF1232 family)